MSNIKKHFTTRGMATLAVFVSLGYGLSWLEIPLFPAAPFLKLDLASVPTMLCGYMTGGVGALIVEGVKQLLIFLTHSDTAGVGQIANFIMTAAFVLPPALLYRVRKGKAWVVIGMVIGSLAQIAAAMLCNRFITFPLYVGDAAAATFASLWYYVLAFNGIKTVATSAITFLVYKRLGSLIDRMFPVKKHIEKASEEEKKVAEKEEEENSSGKPLA